MRRSWLAYLALAAAAQQKQKRRALVVAYGLAGRGAGCSRAAQRRTLVTPLEELGFEVERRELTMVAAPGSVVDGVSYDAAANAPCDFDECLREPEAASWPPRRASRRRGRRPQAVADAAIDALCRRATCEFHSRAAARDSCPINDAFA